MYNFTQCMLPVLIKMSFTHKCSVLLYLHSIKRTKLGHCYLNDKTVVLANVDV